jgi:asparagine synthase (glutamine-hydrolysing)
MCGLAGVFSKYESLDDEAIGKLDLISGCLVHRGPDASGVWISDDRRISFAHRRLSIVDLSVDANQPMDIDELDWVVVFNGEIFNFKELKQEIIQKYKYKFKTTSDTEVINALLHFKGQDTFQELDGQFAIAAYNKIDKEILLARDQFGEKPFYYGVDKNKNLWFSSELNSLVKSNAINNLIDHDSVAQYLIYQYVPEPYSIYKNIKKIPKGHIVKIRDYDSQNLKIFRINFKDNLAIANEEFMKLNFYEAKSLVKDLVINSLEKRLISDVPVGMFLSGGVDSSLTCSLARYELGAQLDVFSLGYLGEYDHEIYTAKEISHELGFKFHPLIINSGSAGLHELIASKLDEPNGDVSCLQTYLLAQFARESVTVVISGDGADELFGGYPRYRNSLLHHNSGHEDLAEIYFSTVHLRTNMESSYLLQKRSLRVKDELRSWEQKINESDNKLKTLREYDLEFYLPGAVLAKVDRMSMASSLEVRTPYLTQSLKRVAFNLNESYISSNDTEKVILRSLLADYIGAEKAHLPKKGFGFPESDWVKQAITKEFIKMISDQQNPIYNFIGHDQLLHELNSSRVIFNPYKIWSILILNAWLKNNSFSVDDRESRQFKHLKNGRIEVFMQETNCNSIDYNEVLNEENDLKLLLSAYSKLDRETKGKATLIEGRLKDESIKKLSFQKSEMIIHIKSNLFDSYNKKVNIFRKNLNVLRKVFKIVK